MTEPTRDLLDEGVLPTELRWALEQEITELAEQVERLKAHLTDATRVCLLAEGFLKAAGPGLGKTGEPLRRALAVWRKNLPNGQ